MADTCPTCGGPRQSFYVAGYERAEAKQAARVAELEAALRSIGDTLNDESLPVSDAAATAYRLCDEALSAGTDTSSKPAATPHGEPQNRVPDEVQKKGDGAR